MVPYTYPYNDTSTQFFFTGVRTGSTVAFGPYPDRCPKCLSVLDDMYCGKCRRKWTERRIQR